MMKIDDDGADDGNHCNRGTVLDGDVLNHSLHRLCLPSWFQWPEASKEYILMANLQCELLTGRCKTRYLIRFSPKLITSFKNGWYKNILWTKYKKTRRVIPLQRGSCFINIRVLHRLCATGDWRRFELCTWPHKKQDSTNRLTEGFKL